MLNLMQILISFPVREEMDSLQKQMEEHTGTVHESMSSWTNAEEGLAELGLQNNISKSPTAVNIAVMENNNDAEQQQS